MTPATMTEVVASVVSAAIRFRRPMPIDGLCTSPRGRLNVQLPGGVRRPGRVESRQAARPDAPLTTRIRSGRVRDR
jgi:hypothetical protein